MMFEKVNFDQIKSTADKKSKILIFWMSYGFD